MNGNIALARPAGFGVGAFGILIALYFGVLALVSGWSFTLEQFREFWFYIVPFAAQFQVELFWVGLAFNAAGIAHVGTKLYWASQTHAQCMA